MTEKWYIFRLHIQKYLGVACEQFWLPDHHKCLPLFPLNGIPGIQDMPIMEHSGTCPVLNEGPVQCMYQNYSSTSKKKKTPKIQLHITSNSKSVLSCALQIYWNLARKGMTQKLKLYYLSHVTNCATLNQHVKLLSFCIYWKTVTKLFNTTLN